MISETLFEILISGAVALTCFSPLLLIILLIRDIKKGDIW